MLALKTETSVVALELEDLGVHDTDSGVVHGLDGLYVCRVVKKSVLVMTYVIKMSVHMTRMCHSCICPSHELFFVRC